IDGPTIQLFVGWFFFCIVATFTHYMEVGNIAHGAGVVLGILVGLAINTPERRAPITAGIGAILLVGLWGATLGRPRVNLSSKSGSEEAQWGYQALVAHRDQEAVRWLREAVAYQPKSARFWYELGVAYEASDDGPSAVA